MADLKARLEEDRALRDVARRFVVNDVQNLRGDMEEQGVATRVAIRMQEGADGVVDDGIQFARENPGRVGSGMALGLSLLFGWLFRDQLAAFVERHWHHVEEPAEEVASDDG